MELHSTLKQRDHSMSSLYAQYAKERANRETVESDDFFVTFTVYATHVYIEDIYIVPERRGQGLCSTLFADIEQAAAAIGVKKTIINVSPLSATCDETVKKMLKMGFKIYKTTEDLIYMSREIK